MRLIYDLAFTLFALFYLPLFFLKGKHRGGLGSRLGAVSDEIKQKFSANAPVWVHGVSVGEVTQAVRLAHALRPLMPGVPFLITTTTVAGMETLLRFKEDEDVATYMPLDFSFSTARFMDAVKPRAVALLETEIWPNLLGELESRKIPTLILNGRISDGAFKRYQRVRVLINPVLKKFTRIAVQDLIMQKRFLALGAKPESLTVTGNMKFDWKPFVAADAECAAVESVLKRYAGFLFIAGSTHEGEEAMLFDAYLELRRTYKDLRLLIAPRHLNRLPAIESQAAKRGVKIKKISDVLNGHENGYDSDAALLLDKMGILSSLYRLADLVFIGGSLVPVGGHNLVEPAYFEKPVLFGPYMGNFLEMADTFKNSGAALEVSTHNLATTVAALMSDAAKRKKLGLAAKNLLELHAGATDINAKLVLAAANKSRGSL